MNLTQYQKDHQIYGKWKAFQVLRSFASQLASRQELVLKYQEKCARDIQIYFASTFFTTSYCTHGQKPQFFFKLKTSRSQVQPTIQSIIRFTENGRLLKFCEVLLASQLVGIGAGPKIPGKVCPSHSNLLCERFIYDFLLHLLL